MSSNLDMSPEEYVISCTASQIVELVNALVKEGHLPQSANYMVSHDYSESEIEYENALNDLHGMHKCLSPVDEKLIIKISSLALLREKNTTKRKHEKN